MDSNKLSGEQRKILRESVLDAFNQADFEMFLSDHLDKKLGQIVAPGPFTKMVFDVIEKSQEEGWTNQLVAAAQKERSKNPMIKTLISHFNIIDVAGDPRLVKNSLERTVRQKGGIEDFNVWMNKLAQLRRWICRIEDPRDPRRALGTGFLVGRDLVITNYHVVEMYIDTKDPALDRVRDTTALRARFDYAVESAGVDPGVEKEFAAGDSWLVDHSKYSKVDPGDQGGLPQPDELDYAIVRLAQPIGDLPGPGGEAKRGFFTMSNLPPQPQPSDIIFIAQHPKGDPLKLALGSVLFSNDNKTRIRYDANTEGGSSGSPCLDAKLNLVALHHGGDPDYSRLARFNQGIPIDRIIERLAARPEILLALDNPRQSSVSSFEPSVRATVPKKYDAFFSYTRIDDKFRGGAITALREMLELGVQVATGNQEFRIFQDIESIEFGQQWQKRIDKAITNTQFLIPIVTPLFFSSAACRSELETFIQYEKSLGRDDLILPIYFVTTPALEKSAQPDKDPLASIIRSRQHHDWREQANLPISAPQVVSAILALGQKIAAAIARTERREAPGPNEGGSKEAVTKASREITVTGDQKTAEGKKILWVDDRPSNNIYERNAMEAYGVKFTLALNTGEALAKLRKEDFDAIISDMGRPPDSQAGYTLLDALRGSGDSTPFFIYAGSRAPEHVQLARRKGAQGSTNLARELIANVFKVIGINAD